MHILTSRIMYLPHWYIGCIYTILIGHVSKCMVVQFFNLSYSKSCIKSPFYKADSVTIKADNLLRPTYKADSIIYWYLSCQNYN